METESPRKTLRILCVMSQMVISSLTVKSYDVSPNFSKLKDHPLSAGCECLFSTLVTVTKVKHKK